MPWIRKVLVTDRMTQRKTTCTSERGMLRDILIHFLIQLILMCLTSTVIRRLRFGYLKKKQLIFLSHFLHLDNLSICSSQQLDSVVVKLHTFGAGVTSLIPTQYPVKGAGQTPTMLKPSPGIVQPVCSLDTSISVHVTNKI